MINIAICDDQIFFANKIQTLIDTHLQKLVDYQITLFSSGIQLHKNFQDGIIYDIVFLDIQMPDMDGIETARMLGEYFKNKSTVLIYISSHDSRAKEVFHFDAHRFLSKPIQTSEFEEALASACTLLMERESKYFSFTDTSGKTHRLPFSEIYYFTTALNHRIAIKATSFVPEFYGKLKEIHKQLNSSGFMLVHQSFLINYQHIRNITYTEITMANNDMVMISGPRRKETRVLYENLRKKEEYFL